MAFKKVADLSTDTVIQLGGVNKKTGKKNPTQIEGYFLGSKTVSTPKGDAKIHTFQTPKGNIGVWGKTDLNSKLASAPTGSMVRATFDRMVPTKNGDMYRYNVEFDDSNTVEPASYEAASDSDDTSTEEESNFSDTEDEDAEAELAALEAQRIASRKANTAALLANRNKNK